MEEDEIIVNDLIEDRISEEEADILICKISNSNASIIKLDWKDSGAIGIAFVDRFLDYLRNNTKKIIDLNLSDGEKDYFRNAMVDSREKKYFR